MKATRRSALLSAATLLQAASAAGASAASAKAPATTPTPSPTVVTDPGAARAAAFAAALEKHVVEFTLQSNGMGSSCWRGLRPPPPP